MTNVRFRKNTFITTKQKSIKVKWKLNVVQDILYLFYIKLLDFSSLIKIYNKHRLIDMFFPLSSASQRDMSVDMLAADFRSHRYKYLLMPQRAMIWYICFY